MTKLLVGCTFPRLEARSRFHEVEADYIRARRWEKFLQERGGNGLGFGGALNEHIAAFCRLRCHDRVLVGMHGVGSQHKPAELSRRPTTACPNVQ
jgi:hypothetical protein